MKYSDILGLNARNHIFQARYNRKSGKRIANSKLKTKTFLRQHRLPHPRLLAVFDDYRKVLDFNWGKLPSAFVLKPDKSYGGEGIMIVTRGGKYAGEWKTNNGETKTIKDFQLHTLDVLGGLYSVHNVPDIAYIEEYVPIHPVFKRYAYRGTPDVGVLVFQNIPVMAFLRLPTSESKGKANLHQGGVGVGIDLGTGITTYAIHHDQYITYYPGTKYKLRGIKIPYWDEMLKLAVAIQTKIRLGYMRVDFVLHPEKGPMILEINSKPGLSIQLANRAGLRRRLERVMDLEVRNAEHGIQIAKSLFASSLIDKVQQRHIVHAIDEVVILGTKGKRIRIRAKIDTGAWRSSVDRELAESLGLLTPENIVGREVYRSALGKQERDWIKIKFYLGGRKITTVASVADRTGLNYRFLIGRLDLIKYGFLIDPRPKS
ncbi:MAG: hypothetical protein GXP43_01605 [bacterium]|nr:hypothetical protein [bacterium]